MPLQLSIQLARVITQVQDFNSIPEQLLMLLAARQDLSPVQKLYNDTKQPLEWVLRQVGWTGAAHAQRTIFNANASSVLKAVLVSACDSFCEARRVRHELRPCLTESNRLVRCRTSLIRKSSQKMWVKC